MSLETILPSFDYIFALRLSYTDSFEDEHIIIKKIKKYLLEFESNSDIVDKYLIDFYKEYNIEINDSILDELDNIDEQKYDDLNNEQKYDDLNNEQKYDYEVKFDNLSESEMMNIFMQSVINNSNNINNYNIIYNNSNIIPNPLLNIYNPSTVTYNTNILMNVINNILNDANPEFIDVVTTLDDEEFSKIKSYNQDVDSDIQCSICFDNLVKDNQVSELPCCHKYHSECINKYLQEYNYICPVCRKEVGKSKAHI
jgi:hypothetical protein